VNGYGNDVNDNGYGNGGHDNGYGPGNPTTARFGSAISNRDLQL
jgi:hypothetical protein